VIVLEVIFWLCLGGVVYAYVGYPLLLLVIGSLRRPRRWERAAEPLVSVIIAAHNEEQQLPEKLENCLRTDYPADRLDWIVASDGSTDGTVDAARRYAGRGVRVIDTGARRGKETAQRAALALARGSVIVFTDAGTRTDAQTLAALVRPFADPGVGCVSSVDRHSAESPAGGEGWYLRYEMFLRQWESRARSLVGLSGSLFAVRREVCAQWSEELPSDFHLILTAVRLGYRGVSAPDARGYYRPVQDEEKEFRRKIRTILRGMTVFFRSLDLLNPFRYGFFSLELASHKLFRWLVPWFLLAALAANAVLAADSVFYTVLLALQALFYLAALAGWKPGLGWLPFRVPFWFCLFNAAILRAWLEMFGGNRIVLWEPTRR
jgi:cellulose synthase/poly-beta-1,6-N-acetylglucosamine synthase-like glycosyltransferase